MTISLCGIYFQFRLNFEERILQLVFSLDCVLILGPAQDRIKIAWQLLPETEALKSNLEILDLKCDLNPSQTSLSTVFISLCNPLLRLQDTT